MAALVCDPELEDSKVTLIDLEHVNVNVYVDAILAHEPDLVGMSIYVWSSPYLVEVAKRLKQARPDCIIIFGGPSARVTGPLNSEGI